MKISIVLPLYNGIKYIDESIQSIQKQTFSDWELIVISEFGNDDGSAEVVKAYMQEDASIRFIQNENKLGLADSLNLGIEQAVGEYIARVDVDDPSYPKRFEKQVAYLDAHQDVFLCGTTQRSVLPTEHYVQTVPTDAETLKATLLFGCVISHCSVMFRRHTFVESAFRYDSQALGEDYDLWTKIMFEHKLVNLLEVLVDHRWGFDNISLDKGDALKQEVQTISARCFELFDMNIAKEDLVLLSGWRHKPEDYATYNSRNFLHKQCELLITLYEKNIEKQLIQPSVLKQVILNRWHWVCECAGIFHYQLPYDVYCTEQMTSPPKISIILPLFEAVNTLSETLDSILLQELKDWELLIINEHNNCDGSRAIANMYAFFDTRIRVISNEEQLGLAESLNRGIKEARTNYIARIDADDLANPKRLACQFHYLETHANVGICQTYQHHFGANETDFIHSPPIHSDALQAKLLFFCDVTHSTVMFRKNVFVKHNLWYNKDAALEDYDLWIRTLKVTEFATIPGVYGEYRVGKQNISINKTNAIQSNMCELIQRQLEDNLGIQVPVEHRYILNGWDNVFLTLESSEKQKMLDILQRLLYNIWVENEQKGFYNKKFLLHVLEAKWKWSKYNESWHIQRLSETIENALEIPLSESKFSGIKEMFLLPFKLFYKCYTKLKQRKTNNLQSIQMITEKLDALSIKNVPDLYAEQDIDKFLLEVQTQNISIQNELAEINYRNNLIPYMQGKKIRMVFLFQVASFWPAWESFYQTCVEDERLDVKFVFLDETVTEDMQMQTAKTFLDTKKIAYTNFESFELENFAPHVMVIQTPYDDWHRQKAHWSTVFKSKGIRLMYIPYGIEISDTKDSHRLHFDTTVINSCWRIYTFSEQMRSDYLKYAKNRNAVRALGLPRFDVLYHKEHFSLDKSIDEKVGGRKIVLWKVHFPKEIMENGKTVMLTPSIEEYITFAKKIQEYQDLFFIFMPHPCFKSKKMGAERKKNVCTLFSILNHQENVFIDERDDYRETLVNADFIMIDRSAVMVEAGALNVPVLYLSNANYYEPLTKAIEPLIDTYYHGNNVDDMLHFLMMCKKGLDRKAFARKKAFQKCIPFFDDKSGIRIKENMIHDIKNDIL